MRPNWPKALFVGVCLILTKTSAWAKNTIAENSIVVPQKAYPLDSNAFASLITCGPGDDFYTTFGHTALRICDSTRGIDYAYNYGMFSFDEPHFYLKFARGHLNYFLGRDSFENFLMEYAFEGRWVQEQKMNLSFEEVNRLYEMMEENYKPENRYYRYDYFADNCATRVRDMVDSIATMRGLPELPTKTNWYNGSFRSAMNEYTQPNLQWWQMGIDILLGARTDRPITAWETMFAPNALMAIADSNMLGVECEAAHQWLHENRKPLHKSFPPTLFFWLIAALILVIDITSMLYNKRAYNKGACYTNTFRLIWLDGILFGIVGMLGLLLSLMWFGTDHYWTKANWNLLWANPLFLIPLFRLRKSNVIVSCVILLCLLTTMTLGCTGVLPQHFNNAVLPICAILFVRSLYRLQKK